MSAIILINVQNRVRMPFGGVFYVNMAAVSKV